VRATQADAYALALRLTGDEHDAHDAVQDAYLRAFRSIRRFRGDAAFSTWLHRITANCSKTLLSLRRRASHQDLDALSGAEDESALADREPDHDPEARSCRGVELDRLARALATLPSGLRAVVVLRDVHDLTHEAIARRLGISLSAAKVRLHRARRRLRDELHGETAEAAGAADVPGPPTVNRPAGATGAASEEAIVCAG
jgi:RNA polymerase sigma-70 factor (ECF subfamily)